MAKTKEYVEQLQKQLGMGPQLNEKWKHYKGTVYVITGRSLNEDNLEPLVHYEDESGWRWTRSLASWCEMVGEEPRYSRVK